MLLSDFLMIKSHSDSIVIISYGMMILNDSLMTCNVWIPSSPFKRLAYREVYCTACYHPFHLS